MSKGELELEKKKKPVEIKVTRDAEDVVKGPNVAFMIDRPAELNVFSEQETTKVMENPLVRREIERRKEADGDDAEWNYRMEILEKGPREMLDQAEKSWVKGSIDKLEKKAEKNAVKEKERTERERLFVEDNFGITRDRLEVHLPKKTALALKYEKRFSSSISDKKRKEKQRNKKSRLYQKLRNEELLQTNITKEHDLVYERASELITREDDISAEDFNDMAQFMIYKDKYKNQKISELMLGGKNSEGHRCVDDYHAHLALTLMADQLMGMDVTGIRMDTDHDIAANALQLESLTNRLAAFTRLSARYNYMETLDFDRKQMLFYKLQALRSVAAYYTMRKEIMSDRMYKEHYDHELSMDVTAVSKGADAATADEQRALAEKLVKSYILGRNMLRINGVTLVDINKKMPEPRFKKAAAQSFYDNAKEELSEVYSDFNLIHLVENGYKTTDEKAANKLDELREEPVMREEAEVGLNEPVETEEQAAIHQKKTVETGFADGVLKTLLSSDELTPLKGTREMGAVRNSIQALQAMLTNRMPDVKLNERGEVDAKAEAKAREEIDGTCITVVMLYKRLTDSVDRLIKRYGSAYSELKDMLTGLNEQCKKESESFREKTLEYRSLITGDETLRMEPRTWMDALKYDRGIFYDLDNDKSLEVKTDGAGASVVYRISRKVPVTDDNPKGEEVVYFRMKDKVPPADNDQLNEEVISRHDVSEETAESLRSVFIYFMQNRKLWNKLGLQKRFKAYKQQHLDPAAITQDFLKTVNRSTSLNITIPDAEKEVAGHIIQEWNDACAKRSMASTMSVSAKIRCGRPLSERNVATSRLATLLGIQSMVCDSRTATVRMNGKVIEGNIMDDTGGVETTDKKRAYTQNAISQIFMMHMFDFICGQTDRHFSNFHAKLKGNDYDQIRCLDNDMSLGDLKSTDIGNKNYNRIMPVTALTLMGLPVSFVNRLMAIDRPYLDQTLGDILDKKELDSLEDRLDYVKLSIVSMGGDMDNAHWDEKNRTFSYTGDMADDAYRQLWAVDKLHQKAMKLQDGEMGWISNFYSQNVEATPIRTMMDERKQAIAGKKKGKQK